MTRLTAEREQHIRERFELSNKIYLDTGVGDKYFLRDIRELLAEIDALRKALEFYADENEWLDYKATNGPNGPRVDSHFDGDNGKRAREALGDRK